FVDRENFVVVVRLDENKADQNAADDRAESELQIGVVPMAESFAGRAEKSAGAGFGRNEGGEHSPPRNATAAEGEVLEIVFLPAHPQADEDDYDEVEKENADVDGEAAVHGKLGDRNFARRKIDRAANLFRAAPKDRRC